jgi:hypothetical protein
MPPSPDPSHQGRGEKKWSRQGRGKRDSLQVIFPAPGGRDQGRGKIDAPFKGGVSRKCLVEEGVRRKESDYDKKADNSLPWWEGLREGAKWKTIRWSF